jgi:hypothetical protein
MTHSPEYGPAGFDFDTALELGSVSVSDQSLDTQMEYRIDRIIAEINELCVLASNQETAHLIEAQKIGIGLIMSRAELVLKILMARKPTGLRIVQNG